VVNHLYGDKGLDYVMDIMEQVVEENPDITMDFMRSMRVTSDHCGLYPRPEQLPRMRRLGIILSCNPNFINRSTPWLDVYGWDKANRISPVGGMIKAGVMPTAEYEGLNYGSGGGITPTTFLSYFLHRTNARGQVVGADEAIDRVSAMKMTTVWASFYVLKEKELGTLETGKWADFTVFSKDYFTIPEEEIPTVIPLMTVLGGKTMSLREEFATELGVDPVGPQLNFEFERDYDFGAPLM
jgi:predicted amidohydrolase YtcJ